VPLLVIRLPFTNGDMEAVLFEGWLLFAAGVGMTRRLLVMVVAVPVR
jgi:hypothetical protein